MPVIFRKQSTHLQTPRKQKDIKPCKIDPSKKVAYSFKISAHKFQFRPQSQNQLKQLTFNSARNSPKRS